MLEDLLQRRPYNAVTDLIDKQVARGLSEKIAFADSDRTLTYGDCRPEAAPSRKPCTRSGSARKSA